MNKSVKILLVLIIFSASFLYANPSLSREERLFLSKLDEEFLEDKDPEEWILFVKQLEEKQFTAIFPHQPTLSLEQQPSKKILRYEAVEDITTYSMILEEASSEKEELFAQKKEEVAFFNIESILEGNTSYGPCLDMIYYDKSIRWKKRIIYSGKWLITLMTKSFEGSDKHEEFVASFEIVSPLGG